MNRNERDKTVFNKSMPWWKEEIYGPDILGMRVLRKKTIQQMAKITGEESGYLKALENDEKAKVSPVIAGKYMMHLSCNMNHIYQLRDILDGKTNEFKESRRIGPKVKKQVYEKCSNRCTQCESDNNLHIHHIKEYAKGGLNDLDNLTLLCAGCHAEVHKDNQAFHLIKNSAEKQK